MLLVSLSYIWGSLFMAATSSCCSSLKTCRISLGSSPLSSSSRMLIMPSRWLGLWNIMHLAVRAGAQVADVMWLVATQKDLPSSTESIWKQHFNIQLKQQNHVCSLSASTLEYCALRLNFGNLVLIAFCCSPQRNPAYWHYQLSPFVLLHIMYIWESSPRQRWQGRPYDMWAHAHQFPSDQWLHQPAATAVTSLLLFKHNIVWVLSILVAKLSRMSSSSPLSYNAHNHHQHLLSPSPLVETARLIITDTTGQPLRIVVPTILVHPEIVLVAL